MFRKFGGQGSIDGVAVKLSQLVQMAGNLQYQEQRARAARELGGHKVPEAIAALGALLYDHVIEISIEACRSLVRIGSPEALPRLLDALPTFDNANEKIAQGVPREVALRTDLHAAIARIAGRPTAEVCEALLGHASIRIDVIAREVMARKLDPAASLEVLLRASRHTEPRVREAAYSALARSGDERAFNVLLQCALADDQSWLRIAAGRFLLRGPHGNELGTLESLAEKGEGYVREQASIAIVDALSRLGASVSAEKRLELERLASETSESAREALYRNLWALGGAQACQALRKASEQDELSNTQYRAFHRFEYDLVRLRQVDLWDAVRGELQRIAAERGDYAGRWAATILRSDPWPPDLAQKIAALGGVDENARNSALDWVQAHRGGSLAGLARRLHESEATRTRFAACCRIAAQAEPQRSAALLHALADADEGMRRIAAWILWELLDLPAPPDLLPGLAHRLPRARCVAASYLGRRREARALPALTALLADADAGVKFQAVRAIAAIQAKDASAEHGAFDAHLVLAAPARPS